MKRERSHIAYPMWRKKVDKSLFEYNGTAIPNWVCKLWGIPELFKHASYKRSTSIDVTIKYINKKYDGWVKIVTYEQGRTTVYRLFFEEELSLKLKNVFLMSYMRSLEDELSTEDNTDVEDSIPFWEFLDIEYDQDEKQFRFVSYYTQKPSFPNLFKRLIGSPAMKQISDELEDKGSDRIYKQDWRRREELQYELGARNVIYMLLDTEHRLLYIGEAQDLIERLSRPYPSIKDWDYFRYDVLPDSLSRFRVQIERMMIRDFATLIRNKSEIDHISDFSDYKLANDKIDR